MKRIKTFFKSVIIKHGAFIATFAFICVSIAANTPCIAPYYEPEEPMGLENFKKYN